MTFRELDTVVVTRDLPDLGLKRGDMGAVVHVHSADEIEAEFVTATGGTQALVVLHADAVRPAGSKDLLAVRQLDAA